MKTTITLKEIAGKYAMSKNPLISVVTKEYLDSIGTDSLPPPMDAASGLVKMTASRVRAYNAGAPFGRRLSVPDRLSVDQLAALVMKYHDVAAIPGVFTNHLGMEYSLLAIYQPGGPDGGIYSADVSRLGDAVRKFMPGVSERFVSSVSVILFFEAVNSGWLRTTDMVAGNNGIFDCRRKQVVPFPPGYAFLDRSEPVPFAAYFLSGGPGWDCSRWMVFSDAVLSGF